MNFITTASAGVANLVNTVKVDNDANTGTIYNKIDSIVSFAIGLIGVIIFIYIIYGGFLYLTSQGNADQTKKAQQIIVFAIIGAIILSLAYGLSRLITNFLNNSSF